MDGPVNRVRRWPTTRQLLTIAAFIGGVDIILLLIGVSYYIPGTGFGAYYTPKADDLEYHPEKTLWDWLGLLIVPAALAVGGIIFSSTERKSDRELAEKRSRTDHDIASDRLRDAALREYLDRMADLLLTHNLATSQPQDPVRFVARARTLTILRTLEGDGQRKGAIVQFLYEADLIKAKEPIVALSGANLKGVSLTLTNLSGADLSGANLSGADLSISSLWGAFLFGANLKDAVLTDADLKDADLSGANLSGARLHLARLTDADLSEANLTGANLTGAHMTAAILYSANLTEANLNSARLGGVDLRGALLLKARMAGANLTQANLTAAILNSADLTRAGLEGANLTAADLYSANLTEANLSGANLSEATLTQANLTNTILIDAILIDALLTEATVRPEQLAQAKSLKGATMPDRSRHD